MRGSLVRRGNKRWAIVLDLGRVADPVTGVRKRKQKWISFQGTQRQAETKLNDLVGKAQRNEFVEPTKLTVIEYLRDWLDKAVKPPLRRPETYRVYKSIVESHVAEAPLATMPLQKVRASDLEHYYGTLSAKPATVTVHHAVFHRALKKAVKDRLLHTNPAADVEHRPRPTKDYALHTRANCWTATEARSFIDAAKKAGTQVSAFCALALDTGARKSELNGLTWSDVDLDTGTANIDKQLDAAGKKPVFGPTKTHRSRTVALSADTVVRLRIHKRAQAELRMRNRTTYADFGLVFAREDADLQTPEARLGQPITTLSESYYQRVVKAAGVKAIKFHGLRHTCATLLLSAGVPVHIVAQRLGHAQASMTLEVYAHALPNLQQDAASKLGAILANG